MATSDTYTLAECVADWQEAQECANDIGHFRIVYVRQMDKCRTYVRMLRALVDINMLSDNGEVDHISERILVAAFGEGADIEASIAQLTAAEALMGVER